MPDLLEHAIRQALQEAEPEGRYFRPTVPPLVEDALARPGGPNKQIEFNTRTEPADEKRVSGGG